MSPIVGLEFIAKQHNDVKYTAITTKQLQYFDSAYLNESFNFITTRCIQCSKTGLRMDKMLVNSKMSYF